MPHRYSRREFIKIAFTTVSTAALGNPIFGQLQNQPEAPRAIAPAYKIAIDASGYLYDPDFDYALPTWREMLGGELGLAELSEDEQLKAFAEWHGCEDPDDMPYYLPDLEDSVDSECITRSWIRKNSEWRVGFDLYESLDEEANERLGLIEVDGEHPGVDFLAVRCLEPEDLPEALLREGINIEIV